MPALAGEPRDASNVRRLVALLELHCGAEADDNEWMYTLDKGNVFGAATEFFKSVQTGRKLPDVEGDGTLAFPDSAPGEHAAVVDALQKRVAAITASDESVVEYAQSRAEKLRAVM